MKILIICNSRCGSAHMVRALFKKRWGKRAKFRSSPGPTKLPDPYVIRVLKEIGVPAQKKRIKALKKSDLKTPSRILLVGLRKLKKGRKPITAAVLRWPVPFPLLARRPNGDLKQEHLRRYRQVRDFLSARVSRFKPSK